MAPETLQHPADVHRMEHKITMVKAIAKMMAVIVWAGVIARWLLHSGIG